MRRAKQNQENQTVNARRAKNARIIAKRIAKAERERIQAQRNAAKKRRGL